MKHAGAPRRNVTEPISLRRLAFGVLTEVEFPQVGRGPSRFESRQSIVSKAELLEAGAFDGRDRGQPVVPQVESRQKRQIGEHLEREFLEETGGQQERGQAGGRVDDALRMDGGDVGELHVHGVEGQAPEETLGDGGQAPVAQQAEFAGGEKGVPSLSESTCKIDWSRWESVRVGGSINSEVTGGKD